MEDIKKIENLLKIKNEIEKEDLEKIISLKKEAEKDRYYAIRNFDDGITLATLYSKYETLVPLVFTFDPEKTMPEIYNNKTALTIWARWRSGHLVSEDMDLNGACIETAKYIKKLGAKEFSDKQREDIVQLFINYVNGQHTACGWHGEKEYWDRGIFPFLEGKKELRYEIKLKDTKKKRN